MNTNTDLVYSPDDGGYYYQEFHPTKVSTRVSKLYDTKAEAMSADREGLIEWGEWD